MQEVWDSKGLPGYSPSHLSFLRLGNYIFPGDLVFLTSAAHWNHLETLKENMHDWAPWVGIFDFIGPGSA